MSRFLLLLIACACSFVKASSKTDILSTDTSIQQTDTLNIIISEKNNFYYYENTMLIDGSNFNLTDDKSIKYIIENFWQEVRQNNNQSIILLKILNQFLLNEDSKRVIEFIKQKKYKKVNLTKVEKKLITLTEK